MKYLFSIILWVSILKIVDAQIIIPFRDGMKWGYSDENRNILVNPQFDEAAMFLTGVTAVKKNGKYAIINKKGNLLTDFEFDKIGTWGSGVIYSLKGGKRVCYNSNGTKTKCLLGCGTMNSFKNPKFITYKKEGKIGFYNYYKLKDSLGNTTIIIDSLPAIWDEFKENYTGLVAVKKEEKWGIIDKEQKIIIDFKYDLIEIDKSEKIFYCFKTSQNGKFGFIDENGKIIVEPKYIKATFFKGMLAKVWTKPDFWFYIDKKGNEYCK